ncbi:MAG: TRAP transporter small permease [Desulfobacterales bacterium]|nr:TRAP transporter small permease [Desulfobacterales bacterium]
MESLLLISRRWVDGLARGLRFAGQLALASMMVTICYDVVMRYVFRIPTSWSLEVNTFMVLFVALVPAGDVLAAGGHLRISFFTDKLDPRGRAVLAWLASLAGCLFCAVMTWKGLEMAWAALKYDERMSSPLGTPMVIPYLFIPIGFGVMCLQYLIAVLVPQRKPGALPARSEV